MLLVTFCLSSEYKVFSVISESRTLLIASTASLSFSLARVINIIKVVSGVFILWIEYCCIDWLISRTNFLSFWTKTAPPPVAISLTLIQLHLWYYCSSMEPPGLIIILFYDIEAYIVRSYYFHNSAILTLYSRAPPTSQKTWASVSSANGQVWGSISSVPSIYPSHPDKM